MRFGVSSWIFPAVALASAIPASAGTLSYTCDPGVAAATCTYLNTTVAGNYGGTFTNANALIYIEYGTTGLASSTSGFYNFVTYSQYAAGLSAQALASGNPVQIAAVAALSSYDNTPYGSDDVSVTSALANALGIAGDVQGGNTGTTSGGSPCSDPGTAGCYNGIITMTNAPDTWYYDNLGGPEPAADYDFYSAAEHETDEILGTASCIGTTTGILVDNCDTVTGNTGGPSAVDLFRYNSAGSLALNATYAGDDEAPAGAYFSYNGGTTNGAVGVGGSSKVYNTLANGDDYADFVSSSPDCGTNQAIQDAEGCPGEDAGLSIRNDGGGEINILNAVGYDVVTSTPEPGTLWTLGLGFASLGIMAWRRRRTPARH